MKGLICLVVAILISGCSSIKALEPGQKKKKAKLKRTQQKVNHRRSSISKKSQRSVVKKSRVRKKRKKFVSFNYRKPSQSKRSLNLSYSKKHFRYWMKYFTGKNRQRFNRFLNNGEKYRHIVQSIFKKHGLPSDLYYVGLIESGYQTGIKSRSNAVGPWQFMKGTAKSYQLRVDRQIDERRNIVKSTEAAAQYFKDLYNIFGSWELALCAYNKGEYGIIRAIRKGNTRDYNVLIRKKLIPRETIYYIPKLVAARAIDQNKKKYGFRVKSNPMGSYKKKIVRRSFRVSKLISRAKISRKEFFTFNPDIRQEHVSVRRRPVNVYLPASSKGNIDDSGRRLSSVSEVYRVKAGDNLSYLANRWGVTVKEIMRSNNLRRAGLRIGQKLKVPTVAKPYGTYIVKPGDNLTSISKKYGISVIELVKYNSIKNSKIFPKQKLFIPI